MTFWATLWYAGSVVLTLGYEGQTESECNLLGQQMMYDITSSYSDPEMTEVLAESPFPTDNFSFSCEREMLPIDEKYTQ